MPISSRFSTATPLCVVSAADATRLAADLARLDSGVGKQLLDHREEPLRMATAAELPGAERPINTLRVTPEQCCRDGAEAGIESENG